MKNLFKAPKLISLLGLVLGLMAFGTTAAQAEPGAYWEVGGVKIEGTSTLLPEIQAKKDTEHLTLLSISGGTNVEIICGPIKFVGAKLHVLGRFTGKIHLEGCITKLNGAAAARCTPKSPGAALGLIETLALDGLIKLHEPSSGMKVDLVELLPEVGGEFVKLLLGNLCAIGNEFPVTGKIFLKDCTNELLVNKVEHLFEENEPLSTLKFGEDKATIDGSFWAFLVGAHLGQSWSGHTN